MLVWLDTANYAGIQGKLPRDFENEDEQNQESSGDEDDEDKENDEVFVSTSFCFNLFFISKLVTNM